MRKIYTGIDIGSDSIKIIVAEIANDNFYVLASTSRKNNGVKRGLIVDQDEVVESLNYAIDDIKKQIDVRIDKAIVVIPSNGRKLKIVSGNIKLIDEEKPITGHDIDKVLENAISENIEIEDELVTITPIAFNIDDNDNILDPRGKTGKELGVKAVIGVAPEKRLIPFTNVFNRVGIEIVDIAFGSIGDYYIASNKTMDRTLGAVINIGEDIINISIFNKRILIKNEIIKLGSKNIDNDLIYVYNIDFDTARYLKENFVVACSKYADSNDVFEVSLNSNEKIIINQEEVTKIVESRIIELLNLSKNQINNLTNRKISYIIVTGGITELKGFNTVVENTLGVNAIVLNDNIIGIRNNKFSSAAGIIKYFNEKMEFKDKKYSMFNDEQINSMMNFGNNNISLLENSIENQ